MPVNRRSVVCSALVAVRETFQVSRENLWARVIIEDKSVDAAARQVEQLVLIDRTRCAYFAAIVVSLSQEPGVRKVLAGASRVEREYD
jgi:hypothetical protein